MIFTANVCFSEMKWTARSAEVKMLVPVQEQAKEPGVKSSLTPLCSAFSLSYEKLEFAKTKLLPTQVTKTTSSTRRLAHNLDT